MMRLEQRLRPRGNATLLTLVLLATAAPLEAGSPQDPWRLWGGAGLGISAMGGAGMGKLVFQKAPHQLSARALVIMDPYDSADDPIMEIGLCYGRTMLGPSGHASFSAGLAYTDLDMDGQSDEDETIGVPLVAEAGLRLLPVLGLGMEVYGNLNSKESYGGVLLFLELGHLPR